LKEAAGTQKRKCISIPLYRKNWSGKAFLGISENSYNEHELLLYLSGPEVEYFNKITYEKKRIDFLAGRFIAKQVLSAYLQEKDLTKIIIKNGIFNQPLLEYPTANPPRFSLSHTHSHSVCLAFPQAHPMGIDMETITRDAAESVETVLTEKEKHLGVDVQENRVELYLQLWTIKEALSKVLQTGLTVPLEIYEVAEMRRIGQYFESTFKNFMQYKAISFRWEGNICSIVLPQKTNFDLNELNAYMKAGLFG